MERFEPTRAAILELIAAAIAAPSADNCHHVRFAIREDGLELYTDDVFAACDTRHRRRLIALSYGAVVENIRLWLGARGRDYRPRWFPSTADGRLLATIPWASLSTRAAGEPLAAYIAERHTNRRFFRGPPLASAERTAIDGCFADESDFRLDWFDERPRRASLLQLIRVAETARFRDRQHHDELFGSIAFDAGWTSSVVEHLAPGSLEVEMPLRGAFKALRHWPVMRVANVFGAAQMLGLRAGDLPARLAPHVVAITSRRSEPDASLEGGRLFQRCWLTAASLGLALQPMAASAILYDDAAINARANVDLPARWRELLGSDWRPVMVFRIGRSTPPRIRSLRRPATDYVDPRPD